jgi:rhodanese-related sulfurtransferase
MKNVVSLFVVIPSAVVVLAAAAFLYVTRTESGFRLYLDRIYGNDFPDVDLVEPSQLARELERTGPPILLDTRSAEEFAVSHIRGALLIDPAAFTDDDVAGLDRARPIVVYCSVGYRSGRIARTLKTLGFVNVRNLYGGIFLWYDQGRPVYRGDRVVQQIHPYNTAWGLFVTRDGKTTTPH